MAHPATGLLRVFRATALGLVAFALALTAHVAAGGWAPSLTIVLVLAMACAAVCLGLTSRRLGPVAIAIATTLGAFELGLHYAFMWLTSASCSPGSATGMASMPMPGGPAVLTCVTAAQGMPSIAQVSAGWMLGAHAAATVATAWVMARGERLVWLMVSAVLAAFSALGPVQISPARRPCEPSLTLGVGTGFVALGGIGRRGPPAQGPHV